jgi:putative transposase
LPALTVNNSQCEVALSQFAAVIKKGLCSIALLFQFWATSDLSMTEPLRQQRASEALAIKEYHRGLKQCCAVERCQAHTQRAQHNHILYAIRAFVRLEWQRLQTGCSWYKCKKTVVREAIRAYRASPLFMLPTTA